ncbi:hypothetical protein SH661x_003727 [Planctomicrobium sp. SH661]|uniref:hypothetical protein n=1 Tax=Planctomicrobium sp. SH661 TaxID=3448124 RepID=UPI003F5B6967
MDIDTFHVHLPVYVGKGGHGNFLLFRNNGEMYGEVFESEDIARDVMHRHTKGGTFTLFPIREPEALQNYLQGLYQQGAAMLRYHFSDPETGEYKAVQMETAATLSQMEA